MVCPHAVRPRVCGQSNCPKESLEKTSVCDGNSKLPTVAGVFKSLLYGLFYARFCPSSCKSRGWHFALDRTIWHGLGVSAEANIGHTPFMTETHRNVVGHPPSFTYQTHLNIHWFAVKVFWRQGFGKRGSDEKG